MTIVRSLSLSARVTLDLHSLNNEGTEGNQQQVMTQLGGTGYYFLWSVERVCVLLDLNTLAKRNWYDWGAEILLSNQRAEGYWDDSRYSGSYPGHNPVTDTCFALLFLKRANLAPDLSDNLRLYIPVVDPDRRGGSGGN